MRSGRFKFFIPAIIWAAIIFAVSSIPDISTPSLGFKLTDKVAHFMVFFILGIFVAFALGKHQLNPARLFWISVGISVVYGITDEVHQYFVPGREMDGFDVLADAIGAAAASWLYMIKLKRHNK